MKSGIYEILNTASGKLYVGSAVNLKGRFACHLSQLKSSTHGNRHLQRAFDKYGQGAFAFFPIEHVENKKHLTEREQFWMDALDVCNINKGYNIAPVAGSTLGAVRSEEFCQDMRRRVISDETRARMSAAQKKRYSGGAGTTEETRRKLSKASLGRTSPMKGKKQSSEAKAKMSASHLGNIPWNKGNSDCFSDETKKKISASLMGNKRRQGIPHSDETKAKMSASHKGKVYSVETRARMSAAMKRRFAQNLAETGEKVSPETRAKMSAAWERRRVGVAAQVDALGYIRSTIGGS